MTEPGGEAAAFALDGGVAQVEEEAPAYKLYPVKHIWWTAVIGGPLPSAWMLAANYKRLGETKKSHIAAGLGALAIVAMVALGVVLDRKFGGSRHLQLGGVIAIAVRSLAMSLQGTSIAAHEARGGRFESPWKSIGIMLVGIAETFFGAAVLVGWLQASVVVGGTHKIILEGTATEADARRMGDVLLEIGALPEGKETEMSLEKERTAWIFTINVNEDFLEKPDLVPIFEPVAQQLRARAFPDGLELKLVLASGLHRKRCELDPDGHLSCR
jgi:hypothetical protein